MKRKTDRDDANDVTQDIELANVGRGIKKSDQNRTYLLQSEIEEAQRTCKSAAEVARKLRVSYATYKKYAKMYGVFENLKNQGGKGVEKPRHMDVKYNQHSLTDILNGKHPKYPNKYLKPRLIREGIFEEECSVCGFSERRVTDGRMPLLLNHIDGDPTNHRLENLEFLCYNCKFLLVGNLTGKPANGEPPRPDLAEETISLEDMENLSDENLF